MKIGVALSGCDIGGVCAHRVLEEIALNGYEPGLISVTSLPATTAYAYSMGFDAADIDRLAAQMLVHAKTDLDGAIAGFADALPTETADAAASLIAINAYDLAADQTVVFTNAFKAQSQSFVSVPLGDCYEMLSACISGVAGLRSFRLGSRLLCDYGARHGCPVAAPRLTGNAKVLSIAFLPETPASAFESMMRLSLASCPQADLHIPLMMPKSENLANITEFAVKHITSRLAREYEKLVF